MLLFLSQCAHARTRTNSSHCNHRPYICLAVIIVDRYAVIQLWSQNVGLKGLLTPAFSSKVFTYTVGNKRTQNVSVLAQCRMVFLRKPWWLHRLCKHCCSTNRLLFCSWFEVDAFLVVGTLFVTASVTTTGFHVNNNLSSGLNTDYTLQQDAHHGYGRAFAWVI